MKTVIILNTYYHVKKQIKDLMLPQGVEVFEATNSIELYKLLNTFKNKIDLLLLDIHLDKEDAFVIMDRIRETHIDLPIIILTAVGRRSQFIKGIQHGAVDYILLPLQEENFMTRVMKYLETKNISIENSSLNKEEPALQIDFQQYLSREFKRAMKGNYSLSIVLCTFFRVVEEFNEEVENEYIDLNTYLYEKFKSLFWETDLFVKYGSQSFIGIFPFSDEKNTTVILNKIETAFDLIKIENDRYDKYNLENVFVTYPVEGSSQDGLLEILSEKMKNAIVNVKNSTI